MLSLLAAFALQAAPVVGGVAPDFTAVDSDGHTVTLSKLTQEGPVILAFFPKAFTGGCTKELTAYQARHGEVEKVGARILAISTDDAATMKRFKAELKAPYAFVPDPEAKLIALYDAKMPLVKIASRVTYVVGTDRKVLEIQKGSEAIEPGAAINACALRGKAPDAAKAK